MSSYNDRDARSGERLTVAGIAAIVVVGVFVVCVILILAKSLFPSNDEKVPEGVYTGTKSAAAQPADDTNKSNKDTKSDGSSLVEEVVPLNSSDTDSQSEDSDSGEDLSSTDSQASGDVMYLNQTAYLRSSGNENADPIFSIGPGEEVTVIERPSDSEYVHVSYGGTEGWIWGGYLS